MALYELFFLDLSHEIQDLLGTAHGKGRDHQVAAPVQGLLEDLGQLFDVLMGPVMGPVAVGTDVYKRQPLKAAAIESAREILKKADQMKDVGGENLAPAGEGIREMTVSRMEMADGTVEIQVKTEEACYFKVISEFSGVPVRDEYELSLIHI